MIQPNTWRKSSYSSSQSDCVEVAADLTRTRVRDTKNRTGGELALPATSWSAFTNVVKARRP
jgi:hypothetical protein